MTMKILKKIMLFFTLLTVVNLCSCSISKKPDISISTETASEHKITVPTETAFSNGDTNLSISEGMAEFYQALEDAERNEEKIKQVTSEELIAVDFTDCSIAALDNYGVKIYERLSEAAAKEFIYCITHAKVNSTEYKELPDRNGGSLYKFQITLNTKEQIYIDTTNSDEDGLYLLVINGEHGYLCDKESSDRIRDFYSEIIKRFEEKAMNQ